MRNFTSGIRKSTKKKNRNIMKKFIYIAAAALALAACGQKKSGTAAEAVSGIADTKFNITELNGTAYQSLGEEPAFIAFEGDRCNASVGGNSIFAVYAEGEEGKITLSEGGATKMMVPEEYREDEFIAAFNAIASYSTDADTVVFCNAEGTALLKAVKVAAE